jgi:4-hydroxy-3-methylbut-2-enyl diphosphate reductase
MSIRIDIDPHSGFCFGVVKAIEAAEQQLASGEPLYCVGEIVHNGEEVARLEKLGMKTIHSADLTSHTNKTVLFRAHGEPPPSYLNAQTGNIKIIDATCPVVLKLQQRVKKAWQEMKAVNGQICIYGKKGHPEVIGLIGQTSGEAILLESADDIHLIDPQRPVVLFSQTTKSIEGFEHLTQCIKDHLNTSSSFISHDTICRQVSGRVPRIKEFAVQYDIIIFVGGKNSSNAKVLFDHCRQANPHSYFISTDQDINPQWLTQSLTSIGICGATSTPRWQLQQVAETINHLLNKETP